MTNQLEIVAGEERQNRSKPADRIALPIAIDRVIVRDRLRAVDHDHVATLAGSMADRGQQQPIAVAVRPEGLKLVAGLHRLLAAKLLGWATISAVTEEGTDEELRLVEIDENLARNNLSALDRAIALQERKRIYEAIYPEAKRGGDRRSSQQDQNDIVSFSSINRPDIVAFSKAVSAKLGLDKRSVERAVKIATALSAEHREALSTHKIAKNQAELLKLAKLPTAERDKAVQLLTRAEEPAKNVSTAVEIIRGHRATAERSPEDKAFERLLNLFGRTPKKVQRRFIEHLQANGQLDGLKGDA
ncbi:ParB N-terminal domain-containing protein [Thalassobaculum litoreum]|uniref:Chromosome partitioning protein, ParB family n=1 Tax=Thalassobaculum litoreum DSM 18839 TaxID=1123362 RepID=A0A8G2BHI3_9PROT|nr:ParB N-terminal domain-containing protein [Thalassobaculum litoreum]SDF69060.1 chromosome partitioning protein, ParB family [Thalassobaculum litoreum DSM 18839]